MASRMLRPYPRSQERGRSGVERPYTRVQFFLRVDVVDIRIPPDDVHNKASHVSVQTEPECGEPSGLNVHERSSSGERIERNVER